jgi:stalled ribosome alternative rescue factor ArfA
VGEEKDSLNWKAIEAVVESLLFREMVEKSLMRQGE